jgi:exopolysaccharide biosynthesis polyprenyl glycosylphosphotransferase
MAIQPAAQRRLRSEQPLARRTALEPKLVAVAEPQPRLSGPLVPMSIAPWAPVSIWSREATKRRLLAMGDAAAVSLVVFGILSRFGASAAGLAVAVILPIVLVVFHLTGLYGRDELRLGHTTLDEAPLLLQLTGLLALGAAILLPSIGYVGLDGAEIAAIWGASFVAILCARTCARAVARRILPDERCLVIGEMAQAERIRHKIATSAARAEVIGYLPISGAVIADHADPETIRAVVEEVGAHRLIIAGSIADADSAEFVRVVKAVGVPISLLPQIFGVVGSAASIDNLEGMTMLGVPCFGLHRFSRRLKRALDLIGSTVGLLLISPVLAAIAAAIRIDSNGPIFFRQTRVGRDGRPFSIFKFRSMVADADQHKDALRTEGGAHGNGLFKIHGDPRITRVGRFLRKTSLDELPQLFNVLRGEMSLVGPRPLVVDEDCQIMGLHRSRLYLTPGMTGPWQLLRARVQLQEMVEIDYLYVTNWSLWQDLKIMLRTVGHVARRGNV